MNMVSCRKTKVQKFFQASGLRPRSPRRPPPRLLVIDQGTGSPLTAPPAHSDNLTADRLAGFRPPRPYGAAALIRELITLSRGDSAPAQARASRSRGVGGIQLDHHVLPWARASASHKSLAKNGPRATQLTPRFVRDFFWGF